MKFSFIVFLGLCVPWAAPRAQSQIDTTLRNFFPMHIGDYWEYRDDDFPTPTLHYYVKVKRDTLMPNGQLYRVFNEVQFRFPSDTTGFRYYRTDDSLRVYKYFGDISMCPTREYPLFQLAVNDRSIWPVCLDGIPGTQDYIGLFSTQDDFFPHLQLDTLSKLFMSSTIDSATGDTLWNSGFIYGYTKDWLAKGLGLARTQGEAGPIVYLIGAIINGRRYGTITSIDESGGGQNKPTQLRLHQNFPNPFNPTTTIGYELPRPGFVTLKIYNILGEEIDLLVEGFQNAGNYQTPFDASGLPSGVYFYRLVTAGKIMVRKMIVTK